LRQLEQGKQSSAIARYQSSLTGCTLYQDKFRLAFKIHFLIYIPGRVGPRTEEDKPTSNTQAAQSPARYVLCQIKTLLLFMNLALNKKYHLTFILTLTSILTQAQCEDLKGDKEGMKLWKAKYYTYFSIDTTTTLIKADSVLIYFLANPANETNYAMPCCYYLAEKYAQVELKRDLKILYKKLEKEDSISFSKAQQAWQVYYKAEWEFLRGAFIGYSNFSKYGLGRETMIDIASRKYQMIKDRILTIKSYIETATTE